MLRKTPNGEDNVDKLRGLFGMEGQDLIFGGAQSHKRLLIMERTQPVVGP